MYINKKLPIPRNIQVFLLSFPCVLAIVLLFDFVFAKSAHAYIDPNTVKLYNLKSKFKSLVFY